MQQAMNVDEAPVAHIYVAERGILQRALWTDRADGSLEPMSTAVELALLADEEIRLPRLKRGGCSNSMLLQMGVQRIRQIRMQRLVEAMRALKNAGLYRVYATDISLDEIARTSRRASNVCALLHPIAEINGRDLAATSTGLIAFDTTEYVSWQELAGPP